MNALRSYLYEFGHAFPQGIAHLKRIETLVDDPNSELPELVCNECRDLLIQIFEISERIDIKTRRIKDLAAETDTARRLQTMLGLGPIMALAIEAFAPCFTSFKRGIDLDAWLGLVPRQHSSGGEERLGLDSKAGQADIRKLLINWAM